MKAWPTDRIGDACTIFSGGTPSKANPNYWRGAIPWVTAKDLKADRICDAELHITQQACDESATKIAPAGALLILVRGMGLANGMQIGEVTSPVAFNQDIRAVIPPARIESRFLLLALRHCLANDGAGALSSAAHGTLKIDSDALRQVAVPVPPLPEQRRIVAILDEAFEGIASAKAHAEKNLRNAREVFEARIRDAFSSRTNRWVECALGDVCEMYQPKTITGKELVADGPYLVFGANGPIGRYTAYNHEDPEVLVTCRGATCGAVNVSEPKSWVTGNAMVVRPLNGRLDKSFLEHMLRSGVDLSSAITGAAQPQITRTNLAPLPIRFPGELEVQRQLAASFGELVAAATGLQDVYQRKLAALDELKQSLLHQAFSGAL